MAVYGLLHVRGGVSTDEFKSADGAESSPRPWRCFYTGRDGLPKQLVFSTSVEVFLNSWGSYDPAIGLLHVRGGVSTPFFGLNDEVASSPRPWRCFRHLHTDVTGNCVFSTSVEVFPCHGSLRKPLSSLLHVRGGVSFGGGLYLWDEGTKNGPDRSALLGHNFVYQETKPHGFYSSYFHQRISS